MNPRDEYFDIWKTIFKYGTYVGWVLIGLIGRFSYDLLQNKKMTWSYVIGCSGVSLLVGYITCVYFMTNFPTAAPMIVPMLTLLSQNIVSFFIVNWQSIIHWDWKALGEVLLRKDSKND